MFVGSKSRQSTPIHMHMQLALLSFNRTASRKPFAYSIVIRECMLVMRPQAIMTSSLLFISFISCKPAITTMTSNPTCMVVVCKFESVLVHAAVQTIRGWLERYLHQV